MSKNLNAGRYCSKGCCWIDYPIRDKMGILRYKGRIINESKNGTKLRIKMLDTGEATGYSTPNASSDGSVQEDGRRIYRHRVGRINCITGS
jgi:hypothetical protein